ncbi:MAG: FecR domain-containing protein [Pseudomonadota bacterium]
MPELSRDVLEAAYQWHVRSLDNDLSLDERDELRAWLAADGTHQTAFDRADMLWQKLDQVPRESVYTVTSEPVDTVAPAADVLSAKARPAWLGGQRLLAIAAGIAAIALISLLRFPESVKQLESIEYRTATAERQDIELSDGSVINLGPRSHVNVAFTDDARRVSLYSGEVYFDVAKDPDKPFEVLVGPISATVIGTEFVAEESDQASQVSVAEGRVMIAPTMAASGKEPRELTPGGQVRVDRSGALTFSETDPDLIGAWRNGTWAFSNTQLADVIADANRYSDQPIEILDPHIGAMTVSLSLDAGDIDALLDNLALAFPIRVLRQSDGAIVIAGQYE